MSRLEDVSRGGHWRRVHSTQRRSCLAVLALERLEHGALPSIEKHGDLPLAARKRDAWDPAEQDQADDPVADELERRIPDEGRRTDGLARDMELYRGRDSM